MAKFYNTETVLNISFQIKMGGFQSLQLNYPMGVKDKSIKALCKYGKCEHFNKIMVCYM